jgi:hypothetical protein
MTMVTLDQHCAPPVGGTSRSGEAGPCDDERAHRARMWLGSLAFTAGCALVTSACGAESSALYSGASPAPAMSVMSAQPTPERPGLGTTFGEARESPVQHVPFTRASDAPLAEARLFYDDAAGIAGHAEYLGAVPRPLALQPFGEGLSIAVVDAHGRTLPGFTAAGRTLVVGELGTRYEIVVHDSTPVRFEIVASVDGLDVIDGRPAGRGRRGYIVDPGGTLVIDGFRTSEQEVAAFRFGRVADSYAAQTSPRGDRDVGVIGVAIFGEQGAAWSPDEMEERDSAEPFPGGQREYARPPG